MKKRSPSILILGGGVAGMAAARSLKHQDLSVHLVEEQEQLGGKAALWSCMATDTCKNCGACLSQALAQEVAEQENLSLHLKTKIAALKRTDQGVEALLTSGETIVAAKVIMATGFSPFDPTKLPSLHWETSPKVITTAELNSLLKEEKLAPLLDETPSPKIAFIQCVGSRNRELGKDYCSQVCCKVSLRHARKILHELPDTRITLFYMDLQIIGKEIRQTLEGLSREIELVQGVPAEILEAPDTHELTMVTEDRATQSRIARQFDLVVLSVGMVPAPGLNETAALLKVVPNGWGFFNTKDAALTDDLYVVGCARGPKDILASVQEGKIAGTKVIEDLGLAKPPDIKVAVLGDGPQAARVAQAVAARGYPVYAFGAGQNIPLPQGSRSLPQARILALDGTVGKFSLYYEDQGNKETFACGAIIAAPEPCTTPNAGRGDFQTAMDLNSFGQIAPGELPEKSLILLDYFGPEFKTDARQALTLAMAARQAGKEITLLMNNMLVHGALGQRLYDQARRSGIRFLRFNTPKDIEIQPQKTGFHIRLKEATLPAVSLTLECDCLVLPENIRSCQGYEAIAKLLRSSLDQEGFLQPANVRHRLVQSPRKGLFYAGTGHDEVDEDDLTTEIQDIIASLHTQGLPKKKSGVKINEKRCAKCLTCYRICPHAAIILNEKMRPQIMEDACFSCHLCYSNCPAYAIESEEFTNDQIANRVANQIANQVANQAPDKKKKDQVVIFACERSAALAAEKLVLPKTTRLISLPCACRISCDMILKAMLNGASKIIVSGCHDGNCRSMEGSITARLAVDAVARMPGIPPGSVAWETAAANESHKFERLISKA
jgi:heterodisulfide reductase subunit A-like polyferredoxin/coenzyme F420-reducing hydrogenase delta subunit